MMRCVLTGAPLHLCGNPTKLPSIDRPVQLPDVVYYCSTLCMELLIEACTQGKDSF